MSWAFSLVAGSAWAEDEVVALAVVDVELLAPDEAGAAELADLAPPVRAATSREISLVRAPTRVGPYFCASGASWGSPTAAAAAASTGPETWVRIALSWVSPRSWDARLSGGKSDLASPQRLSLVVFGFGAAAAVVVVFEAVVVAAALLPGAIRSIWASRSRSDLAMSIPMKRDSFSSMGSLGSRRNA